MLIIVIEMDKPLHRSIYGQLVARQEKKSGCKLLWSFHGQNINHWDRTGEARGFVQGLFNEFSKLN